MAADLEDAKGLIDLAKAAERLGISPIFLRWSLEAGLPLTMRVEAGRLCLSLGRSERDGDSAPQQAAAPPQAPLEPGAAATPHANPPEGELAFLRQRLVDQDASLERRDKLTADLALRLAALGESALRGSFALLSVGDAAPHLPLRSPKRDRSEGDDRAPPE